MKKPRVGRRGLGWLWPAQPCGLPYEKFRSGLKFADAYEWLAYRTNERGESFRPSQKRIVSAMAQLKREMYEQYQKGCAIEQGGGKPSKTWADCRRVCKTKSRPCGKTCVSKKRNCRKPPLPDVCSIEEFQVNLPLEQAAAEQWEERRAGEAMPEEGDTSFDFALPAAPPVAAAAAAVVDDDWGYEPPSRYGFTGLGRLTPAQKRMYAARRLVPPSEAIERIRARHGAALPERLPEHILPFADFMAEAAAVEVTPRRIAKAYVITRSSVRRQGRKMATVCETFPGYRELARAAADRGEEVRPEDAMSVLLRTEDGQAYLDGVERGEFAAAPARRLVRKLKCFGLSASLLKDLRAAVDVAHNAEVRSALRSATPEQWLALVDTRAVPGIGPAKAGFVASLLGRGDLPTFDAREIALWRRRGSLEPQQHDVLALRERLADVPMAMEPRHEPYRQHLVHHALWDAYAEDAPTQTTHQEVIDAMRLAGLGGFSDTLKGRDWARRVYAEKLAAPETLPQLGRGYSDALRAARGVAAIAEKKLYAKASAGRKRELPLPAHTRDFWKGVLTQANELAMAADTPLGDASRGASPWETTVHVNTEYMRSDERGPRRVSILAKCDGRVCGSMDIARGDLLSSLGDQPLDDRMFLVEGVYVDDNYQRHGVGTRLYEAAAEFACANGATLASGQRLRGAHSNDFWRKQIAKGRATTLWRHPKFSRFNLIALRDCPTSGHVDLSALGGGRGGAAANRGRYKPLPPGASAVDQHRALEKVRQSYIDAIESGRFELCPKGSARPTPAAAPVPSGPPGSHGNRTASEIEAVRRRLEAAGL